MFSDFADSRILPLGFLSNFATLMPLTPWLMPAISFFKCQDMPRPEMIKDIERW